MEFCNAGCEHCPISMRLSSHREAEKAKIRAELLAAREREILEEEVRRELGWERGIRFGCCHGQQEETPPVASSWDKFYDNQPEYEGLRRRLMGSLDRSIADVAYPHVCSENYSALREAKKMKIRAELLARRERRVLEEEVRRELGLEREEIRFGCCHGQRDDGCLVPRSGLEERHSPSFIKDTLRRTPVMATNSVSTPGIEPVTHLKLLPMVNSAVHEPRPSPTPVMGADLVSKPCFEPVTRLKLLPMVNSAVHEPRPSPTPVMAADSVSKPCIEPVTRLKLLPMVNTAVHERRPSPVFELDSAGYFGLQNKPLSNNYSGIKRKFACDLCQVTATSKESLDDHFNGKRHKAVTASNKSYNISPSMSPDTCSSAEAENSNKPENWPARFSCKACGLKCASRSILYAHLSEKKHWISSTGN